MNDWFDVEKIDSDTYAISEYRHWEETHCYLLRGTKAAVLIDTGLGVGNIRQVIDGLTALPLTVLTTHAHWDHIGGHRYFDQIAVHEAEAGWLAGAFPISLQVVKRNLTCRPCDFPADFQLDSYQLYQGAPQRMLRDGDRISLGGRTLTVLHTPGHSPGHCCFYEPERRYLYSGDLIYAGCLDAFYPTTDPQLFRQSVKRLQPLEIDRILPAHHQLTVPVDLLARVGRAFDSLEETGQLRQGNGVFDFGDFQIHL